MSDKKELALQAIELARNSGKIKKGTNEVTKAIEKGIAKLVVYAKDTQPAEIIMHIPLLAKEKNVPCIEIESREELGAAAGLHVGTASVAIVVEGESKKIIAEIVK
ncbi:MAG TPA: ribosomal L7Ae/L30e/S12e/Gadd45 family protein [Candidatus Nanoarchaeia archaeon]|nr:ribosomal L7Ae/L30e/S12e/Gadd45 family protein [Candidatus Nanoarchaeia archaeon]